MHETYINYCIYKYNSRVDIGGDYIYILFKVDEEITKPHTVEEGPKTDSKRPAEEEVEDSEESLGPKRSVAKEDEEEEEAALSAPICCCCCCFLGIVFSIYEWKEVD